MTTDERIQKLVERHEALAQTVEMQTHNIETLTQRIDETRQMIVGVAHNLDGFAREMRDNMSELITVARIHEHRITSLEARL
jgi:predicted RNase H-like nuclease (RuvC/YqgF family)